MPTPARAETTAFSLDVVGRYLCNGLDEAIASTSGRPDAPNAGGASAGDLRNLMKLEAPLAVEGAAPRAGFFPLGKFSSIPLLIKAARAAYAESKGDDVKKRLMVVPRIHTTRLNVVPSGGGAFRVASVGTDQGEVELAPQGVVIIALGTIESTRLALASFENKGLPTYDLIGRNLMAHLRSN